MVQAVTPETEARPQAGAQPGQRLKLATVWLEGCSGCHMSMLDMDEWLFDLGQKVDLVYSPFVDAKAFPTDVDAVLIEGSIGNVEQLEIAHTARANSRIVISMGDCAVAGNVPAIRNATDTAGSVLERAYQDLPDWHPGIPPGTDILPALTDRVEAVHAVIPVDIFLPGCPPPADRIRFVLEALIEGKTPEMVGRELLKFG